jgi:hypothetical protein
VSEPGQPEASGGVTISRLALDVPGLDAARARRLAQLVATHLAHESGGMGDVAIPRLTLTLSPADTSVEQIAWAIARAIRAARPAEPGR